jgi:DnaK suppressor protein
VVLIVIAIGFVGYRALYGGSRPETATGAVEPQKSAEPPTVAQPAVEQPAAEPTAETTQAAVAATPEPETVPASEEQLKAATAPAAALPGTPASQGKAARPAHSRPVPKAETATLQPPPAPAAALKASPKAPQVAAVPPAPAEPDRWQMYADAMGRCAREDFFKRFACEQRTRWHYCQGYWGQVPQCPYAGAQTTDRSQ